ncbi:keratin, type I cytoskeletal 18-like [Astyanax mexicanus]|uniref:keratin, type I cytoskeletal 18-like n=1 Tax=Astyanax mexicanus TaxID=7994 RepID=UPI0020CAFDF3|nr:keratin, type I cytoskeletal 18-like [Astyanax mexicanus]XP_022518105.2 keratin, type I cytoskeletal 18-like [Astyanax mexicanus]
MLLTGGLACFVLELNFPSSKTLPPYSPFLHTDLPQLSTLSHTPFTLRLFWSSVFTSMFTSRILTFSGSSCAWDIGLCHADMTEATTVSRGLGFRPGLVKRTAAGSRLDMGLAVAVGSSPATSFMSHTIRLRSEMMTSLPGSTSGLDDGGFGLFRFEPMEEIKSRVRELQEESKALEARLAELTGGVDSTAMETDAVVNIEEQQQVQVQGEYCKELEHLALDTIRLHRMLNNIRSTALELKAQYDIKQEFRVLLEADTAAMKKEIMMTSRLQLNLQTKKARLRDELYFINIIQHEMQHRQPDFWGPHVTLLGPTETEITACKMKLQALLIQLHNLTGVNQSLNRTLARTHFQANYVISRYQAQIARLEAAIEAAKSELQEHIITHKEVQDLMQALGAETATYWALLDGEELSASIQINRTSSSMNLSESVPDSNRTSSPLNTVQTDIAAEAQPEETESITANE